MEAVMDIVLGLMLANAIVQSLWWVLQRKLIMGSITVTSERVMFPNNIVRVASGCGALMLVAWSLLLYGWEYHVMLPAVFWLWLGATVVLNVVIAYALVKAIQKSTPSVAVHVTYLAPVVAIGTGKILLAEQPGLISIAGILTIFIGIYVLHFDPRRFGWNILNPAKSIWRERGNWLWFALLVAVCGGISLPIDKQCVRLSNHLLGPGLTLALAWGIYYSCAAFLQGDFSTVRKFPFRRTGLLLVAVAVTIGAALACQGMAYGYAHAASIGSLKRLDAPFAILWAQVLLSPQERHMEGSLVFRLIGSLIAFMGAVLIGFGK